jgi:hypothetical protein
LTLLEAWSLYRLLKKFSENLVWDKDLEGYRDDYQKWILVIPKNEYLAIKRVNEKLWSESWITTTEWIWASDFLDKLNENLYWDTVSKCYRENAEDWVVYYDKVAYLAIKRVVKKWINQFWPTVSEWLHQKEMAAR